MLKKILKGITAFTVVAIVASCAGNTITGIKNSSEDQGFNVLGNEKDSHFGKGHSMMKGFIKELNLTTDQKAQFEAMKKEMKGNFSKHKADRTALMATLKTAFLSDTINKEDLKAKLNSLKPKDDERETLMASNLINAYSILTPEQRTKIENKINDMEAKFKSVSSNPMFKMFQGLKGNKFDSITSDLNLNDTQKADIKALFEESAPDKITMIENMINAKNTVLAELKTGSANKDKIVSVIKEAKNTIESKMDSRLDKVIKIHDTLNAEQRQKLVSKVETMMSKFRHKRK